MNVAQGGVEFLAVPEQSADQRNAGTLFDNQRSGGGLFDGPPERHDSVIPEERRVPLITRPSSPTTGRSPGLKVR
jgi:hypothetical protein